MLKGDFRVFTRPIVAFDIEVVLKPQTGFLSLFKSFPFQIDEEINVFMRTLMLRSSICFIADMTPAQLEESKLILSCYNYVIAVRSADECQLFLDTFTPFDMFSNCAEKWNVGVDFAIPIPEDKFEFMQLCRERLPIG